MQIKHLIDSELLIKLHAVFGEHNNKIVRVPKGSYHKGARLLDIWNSKSPSRRPMLLSTSNCYPAMQSAQIFGVKTRI